MITRLAAFTSHSIGSTLEVLNKHESEVEKISSSAPDARDFAEIKSEFVVIKKEIKDIENKIDSDLYIIQDNLKKALVFGKETESTPQKFQEDSQRIKRVQSSYDMNKKSIREKLKGISDKINSIELKIAIISKLRKEDVSETEGKTIKISMFDSPELSNIESNLPSP